MEDSFSKRLSRELYGASLWVIRARWYYAVLAFLLGLIAIPTEHYLVGAGLLLGLGCIAAIGNFALYLYLERRSPEDIGEIRLWRINVGQIIFDLLYIFAILLVSGSALGSFVHVFFFVPIIAAMILFGFRGTMAVAGISSAFLVVATLSEGGLLRTLLTHPSVAWAMMHSATFIAHFVQTGVVVLIYLLIGFFSGNVARTLGEREAELRRQFLEQEANMRKLGELTRDFELSSKLLVRRDIELTIANERMQALDKMKSEIISVAAHQLRTPLSGLKWMLKMLLDGDAGVLTEVQSDMVRRGFEANDRLVRLVNDLLAVDRLESGRVKYVFVPVDICVLVDKIVTGLVPKATEKRVRLSCVCGHDVPKLPLDPERIGDLIANLVDNAIKYSREDSDVLVTVERVSEGVRFAVKDSGIGIPEKDQVHVFSRFYRASNAMQYVTEGSGLGLSIAQNVVLRHGGKIWFTSEEGEGTTFFVQLPASLRVPEVMG